MEFSATRLGNRILVPETRIGIFIGGVLTGVAVATYLVKVARPTQEQFVYIYPGYVHLPGSLPLPPPPPSLPTLPLPPLPPSVPPPSVPPPPQTKQQQPPEPAKFRKWFPW